VRFSGGLFSFLFPVSVGKTLDVSSTTTLLFPTKNFNNISIIFISIYCDM
jgi:hypothetical protein